MKIQTVTYNQFFDGIAPSRHIQKGFDSLINCDVHTDIGSVTAQLALASDATSGASTETCVQCTAPSGTVYFFSTTTGKIWKRTTAGVYSSVTANTNTAHRGCTYYNGNLWYWTATRLGVFNPDTETGRNNNYGAFSNSNAFACCEENLILFITDGKYVASVNPVITS